ncbi:MAG: SPFH domain-containing protein, partial [Myxococcales bacterium]|nr:SPFH domain-containing protein [Myxococcales bacterium]
MGILDFAKDGVKELMIARPDDQKNLLVWKYPDQTIPFLSQLTVDADEAAVFFRDGALVGTLRTAGPGERHTLKTENIPFLGKIVDKFTGGNVFVTDLFFVTMRPMYNVPFGGELGYVEDALLGEMVTPRIFGTFSYQVKNPEALIVKYLGVRATTPEEQQTWVKGLLLNAVRTVVGRVCVEHQKSFLELMPLQQELARAFKSNAPELADIGLEIVEVGQFNINLSDDDEARLQKAQGEIGEAKRAARKAQIGIAQAQAEAQARQFELDQNFQNDARYVQNLAGGNFAGYAAGKAMMGAGQGMASGTGGGGDGGAMMGGAGLGVGVAMGQAIAQGMAQGGAQSPNAQAPNAQAPNAQAPAG